MKIMVVGQPASGLFLLSKYLRETFGLVDLNIEGAPSNEAAMISFINAGNFPDNSIFTHHFSCNAELLQACRNIGCHVICTVKHPYDMFESMHKHVNSKRGTQFRSVADSLLGKGIDSEECISFIEDHHKEQLLLTESWFQSRYASMIRVDRICQDGWKDLSLLCERLNANKPIDTAKYRYLFDGQCGDSSDDTFVDATLPISTIEALNKVIPGCFAELGYQVSDLCDEQLFIKRLSGFSKFIDAYNTAQRIFLVGSGKSGTTWLHLMFFHHPNVAATAERRLIEHPDENTALFDILLNDELFESWFTSSSFGKTNPSQHGVRYEMSRILSDYLVFRALSRRKTNKGFRREKPVTHFSEKIALNTESDALATITNIKSIYPSSKVVHIIRDPRDVAISTLYHLYRNSKEQNEDNWITDFVDSKKTMAIPKLYEKQRLHHYFKEQAANWSSIVSTFHTLGQSKFNDNYYPVLYEDMLKDPRNQVKALFDYCGLESSEELLDSVMDKTSFQTLSSGRNSGTENTESFYRKGISGDWMNYISQNDSEEYFEYAKETMMLFNYK